jgi:hypothetical protein
MAVNGYDIINVANPAFVADLDAGNPAPNTPVLNFTLDRKPFGNLNQQVSPSLKVSLF